MKQFACGDVVPGCDARFVCSTAAEVLVQVLRHAAEAHSLQTVPAHVLAAVRSHIVTI